VRTDRKGAAVTDRTVDYRGSSEYLGSLSPASGGGAVLAGWTSVHDPAEGIARGYADTALAIRLDSRGRTVWSRTYPRSGNGMAGAVLEAPDGGHLLLGTAAGADAGRGCGAGPDPLPALWALRLDSSGGEGEGACLDLGGFVQDVMAVPSGDGGGAVAVARLSKDGGRHHTPVAVKVSFGAEFGAVREFSPEGHQQPAAEAALGGGRVAVAGWKAVRDGDMRTRLTMDLDGRPWIVVLGPGLETVSRTPAGFWPDTARIHGMAGTPGGLAAAASEDRGRAFIVMETGPSGEPLRTRGFSGRGFSRALAVAPFPDGSLAVAGETSSWTGDLAFRGPPAWGAGFSTSAAWVMKFAPGGMNAGEVRFGR
jgi:hypothetical protein